MRGIPTRSRRRIGGRASVLDRLQTPFEPALQHTRNSELLDQRRDHDHCSTARPAHDRARPILASESASISGCSIGIQTFESTICIAHTPARHAARNDQRPQPHVVAKLRVIEAQVASVARRRSDHQTDNSGHERQRDHGRRDRAASETRCRIVGGGHAVPATIVPPASRPRIEHATPAAARSTASARPQASMPRQGTSGAGTRQRTDRAASKSRCARLSQTIRA